MTALAEFLAIPAVAAAVSSPEDAVAVVSRHGAGRTLHIRDGDDDPDGDGDDPSVVSYEDIAGIPPVWAGTGRHGRCIAVDAETSQIVVLAPNDRRRRLFDSGAVATLVDGKEDRVLYVSETGDLLVHDLDRDETRRTIASDLDPLDGPYPVVDDDWNRLACATRTADGTVRGKVLALDGDSDLEPLADGVVPFDIDADGEELLVSDGTVAGKVGVSDLDDTGTEWLLHEEDPEVPFSGLDTPVAFGADAESLHVRRMVEFVGQPGMLVDRETLVLADFDGYVDREANGFPRGRLHGGDVLLARESPSCSGEVLAYDYDTAESRTLHEVGTGTVPANEIRPPSRIPFPAVDDEDGDLVVYGGPDEGEDVDDGAPRPVVVELYGGNKRIPARFRRYAQFVAAQGAAFVQVCNPADPWTPAEHENHARASDHLASQNWVDADRLVAYGFSHGGYDARMQALEYPESWHTCVAVSGYSDLFEYDEALDGATELRGQLGSPEANREAWEQVSPRQRVDGSLGCRLALVDIEDDFIPGSAGLVEALRAEGCVPGRMLTWETLAGQSHKAAGFQETLDRWTRVFDHVPAIDPLEDAA